MYMSFPLVVFHAIFRVIELAAVVITMIAAIMSLRILRAVAAWIKGQAGR